MKSYENSKKCRQKNKTRHPETSNCISYKQSSKQHGRNIFKKSRLPNTLKLAASQENRGPENLIFGFFMSCYHFLFDSKRNGVNQSQETPNEILGKLSTNR